MAENKTNKYFLDLGGLTTLWNKIKSTFADKAATETAITNINTAITEVKTDISGINNDVNELETTILSYAPKQVENYSKALEAAKALVPGTILDVKNSETIKDEESGTSITYAEGLYIVESSSPAVIKFLSTSTGSDQDSGIEGLNIRVENLEKDVVKSAVITDGTNQIGSYSVTNNVLLIAHDDTFDINSDSVKALTHRAIAAKFRNLENVISGIPKFKVSVVDELPTKEISTTTIYLVKNALTSTNNLYTEYIYVEKDKDTWDWEKLGEQSLEISDIVTQQQLNNAISGALRDYMKTTDMQNWVNEQIGASKTDILKTVSETYATKEDFDSVAETVDKIDEKLDSYLLKEEAASTYLSKTDASETYLSKVDADLKGWMTEAQIITSIHTGNIGEAIRITDEQITDITTEK